MESSYANSVYSISYWDYLSLFLFRPLLAFLFVLSVLLFGWLLAWKLVLVHVPLVQEIFGLRKKPVKAAPPKRRFAQFYNSLDACSNQVPGWTAKEVSEKQNRDAGKSL